MTVPITDRLHRQDASDALDPLAAFARALHDPALPAPTGLRCWNGSDPTRRLAVHRNTRLVSLTQALADTFPAVQRALGSETFAAMARAFISLHPPRSPVLTAWGDDLPEFLAQSAVTAQRPWLADLARLERLRVQACHAADAQALPQAAIASQLAQVESLPAARLALHPSLSVCVSAHAVVSLWLALQGTAGTDVGTQASAKILQVTEVSEAADTAQAAVVLRDGDAVLVLPVPLPAARCIQALAADSTLQAAVQAGNSAAASTEVAWNLADTLALLMRHHAVVGWQNAAPGKPAEPGQPSVT